MEDGIRLDRVICGRGNPGGAAGPAAEHGYVLEVVFSSAHEEPDRSLRRRKKEVRESQEDSL